VRVDIVAQITPELREKFLARRDVFGALFWIRKNPVEIEPADEKIARETAAFVERIARTFRQLERGRFARRHFRGVDHRRGRCWLRRRFFGYLFFRCFEGRFHGSPASVKCSSVPSVLAKQIAWREFLAGAGMNAV